MKDLGATKNVEAAKFEGVWDELESKKCLRRQYLTEYLRVALVFVWGGTQREGVVNFCFSGVLCWCWRGDWALGFRSMDSGTFLTFHNFLGS